MLRSVDSHGIQQIQPQSIPSDTGKSESGGKAIASYSSLTSDGERSVVNITSQKQELSTEEVRTVRDSFILHFGDDAAKLAFRQIDHRMGEDRAIRGEHVLAATVAAMEFVSPEIRLTRDKLTAEGDLAHARTALGDAQKELAAAKQELADRRSDHEQYGERGSLAPGLTVPLEQAKERLAAAEAGVREAEADVALAEKTLARATDRLVALQKALAQPLLPGDDQVRLKGSKNAAERAVDKAQGKVDKAEAELRAAKAELAERRADYDRYGGPGTVAPGLTIPLDKARERVAAAEVGLAEARAGLDEAREDLADVDAQLTALQVGPHLRRAQAMLDNLGSDPRFIEQLDKVAPGKATGGGLGKLEGVINDQIFGKVLMKAVSAAAPPVGIGILFKRAISAEDCERRLDSATRHIHDAPLAKGLGETLARGKEMEKWKLGIEGTVGFVGMALSMKGASAIGTPAQPLTTLVSHSVSHGTQSLGWLVGGAVTELSTLGVGMAPNVVGTTFGQQALESGDEGNQRGSSREQLAETRRRLEVPEGTALPVIPVRPFGSLGDERIMPLSDPDVAVAFPTYLGPGADESLLGNPQTREMEERRLELRQEMFGAPPEQHLVPGTTVSGDKALVEQLDLGSRRQSSVDIGDASLLHLLYAGVGWTT